MKWFTRSEPKPAEPAQPGFTRGQRVKHRLTGEVLLWTGAKELVSLSGTYYYTATGRVSTLRNDYSILYCFPEEVEEIKDV